jgi:hypothetical protein
MPALTRRRYQERDDCWHVYYGDVQVGTIAARAGVPLDVDQWGWQCGFYPASHHGRLAEGTAEDFVKARSDFETAWREYLPQCTENDFEGYRRQRAWTAWKYAMFDTGLPLPTQSGRRPVKVFLRRGYRYARPFGTRLRRPPDRSSARMRYVSDRPFATPEGAARANCSRSCSRKISTSANTPTPGDQWVLAARTARSPTVPQLTPVGRTAVRMPTPSCRRLQAGRGKPLIYPGCGFELAYLFEQPVLHRTWRELGGLRLEAGLFGCNSIFKCAGN